MGSKAAGDGAAAGAAGVAVVAAGCCISFGAGAGAGAGMEEEEEDDEDVYSLTIVLTRFSILLSSMSLITRSFCSALGSPAADSLKQVMSVPSLAPFSPAVEL